MWRQWQSVSVPSTVRATLYYRYAHSDINLFRPLREQILYSWTKKSQIVSMLAVFLADRTATQYDRLLASSCRLSVCLWRCASWLSGSVYIGLSCASVFLAGKFLFVPSVTFAVGYRLTTKRTGITSRRKREPEFFMQTQTKRVHWFIAHYLL